MHYNILKVNIQKLKESIDFVIRFLEERELRRPEPEGPHPSSLVVDFPHREIKVDDIDGSFLFELIQEAGKIVAELNAAKESDHLSENIIVGINSLEEEYRDAFRTIIQIQQYGGTQYGYFHTSCMKFREKLYSLERHVLIEDALQIPTMNVQTSHIERVAETRIKEIEKKRIQVRQQAYFKADRNAEKLAKQLLHPPDDITLDLRFGHLLYLAGFDYETLHHNQGDIDVLAYNTYDNVGLLIETTTGSIPKAKIDQIYGRKEEYSEFFAKFLNPSTTILLLAVTNKQDSSLDSAGKREAMLNKVSIFTSRQLTELVGLLQNGKLDRFQVIEMVKKSIPVT